MKKYIVRPSYIKKVEPFIDKALIKVMTGQRRIGKSYMLLQIADMLRQRHLNANFIYIDKEQLDFAALKTEQDLYQYVQQHLKQSSPNYLFIDEVQEIDNFQLALRSLLNENACDIYCTGSNARILSGELATHLAGRYIEIHVHSLSYQEFLDFNQLEADGESLRKYLIFGGMPYLHNLRLFHYPAEGRCEPGEYTQCIFLRKSGGLFGGQHRFAILCPKHQQVLEISACKHTYADHP